MEASDIVIHRGEKEEKYQLYVEDYVMSYLKNYRTQGRNKIFFYGERKLKGKKYYIYGAGRQKQISYFEKYELLDEITCHYVMDMPVFSVIEKSGTYELAGYYIFYQSNDAMQSYMVEQRKAAAPEEKEENNVETYIKNRNRSMTGIEGENTDAADLKGKRRSRTDIKKRNQYQGRIDAHEKVKNGNALIILQLSAIFVIIAAIVINSTNSYDKLKDLGQAAVEVFFVMENQDVAEIDGTSESNDKADGETGVLETSNETVLRLTDLDEEFAKENNTAKDENDSGVETQGNESQASGSRENAALESDEQEDGRDMTDDKTSSSEQAFSRNITEYYRIEKGDTLYTISIKIYGDSSKVAEICELNQITNPDHIESGQKILLP
ncbi:MAG: LysM peptidoglycan-binding domain-containing protein [Butyrivibrio sp.]|nr:LysM peptidoglycan-binding domain-containing protein [Butyrivibrio sp.]